MGDMLGEGIGGKGCVVFLVKLLDEFLGTSILYYLRRRCRRLISFVVSTFS